MARRSWLLFAAMCIIWGIPYLLIRVAVRDVAPGTLVFARTAIGGLILLPLALRGGGFAAVLRRWRPLAAFTVIEVAVPWLLLSDAEQKLSSSLAGLLVAAVPLIGVLVARMLASTRRVSPGCCWASSVSRCSSAWTSAKCRSARCSRSRWSLSATRWRR